MLRVSFSPVPECDVSHCWKRASGTPPCHQTPVVIVIVVLYPGWLLLLLYQAYQKAIYSTGIKFLIFNGFCKILKIHFSVNRRFTYQNSKLLPITQYPKDAHDPCASFPHLKCNKTLYEIFMFKVLIDCFSVFR